MPIVTTNSEHYQNIADTIRSYTGREETFRPENMYGGIDGVYMAGYQAGQAEGGGGSYDEGYEQGKIDAIENLPGGYLKIDPTWTSWQMMCAQRPTMLQNLKYSDSSNVTTLNATFQSITAAMGRFTIPSLDTRKVTDINNMCLYSSGIVEIGEMDISNVTTATTAYNGCSNLERIFYVPNCIKVSIGFPASSKLDDASVQSIVDGYADMTGQTSPTLTVHNTVGGKMTPEQKATLTAKNVTLVIK